MHMETAVSLALLLALSALLPLVSACDSKDEMPTPAAPAHPTAAPSAPAIAPRCRSDADCTRPWNPGMDGCGSLKRCFEGACLEPPAITGEANPGTGRIVLEAAVGEKAWQVEVVRAPFETQRGLMCRPSMQRDWGMLFLLESTRIQAFWMKNTLIPLDMVFIREDWTVAGVVADVPPQTLESRAVRELSRYVLELSAGEARRAGLTAGVHLRYYAPRSE